MTTSTFHFDKFRKYRKRTITGLWYVASGFRGLQLMKFNHDPIKAKAAIRETSTPYIKGEYMIARSTDMRRAVPFGLDYWSIYVRDLTDIVHLRLACVEIA